jgi:hypothetical protein
VTLIFFLVGVFVEGRKEVGNGEKRGGSASLLPR